ncbi:MAG: polyprenyl synthetase family protein [Candidatus Woesearchaeota archaeon]
MEIQNMREHYELEKKDVTSSVDAILESRINLVQQHLGPKSSEFIHLMTDKRSKRAKNNGRLRDILVKLVLSGCGVSELGTDHYKVIAAGELYNMASYYQNWHLDDKSHITSEVDKKLCHIASHIFRELAHQEIYETGFDDSVKLELLHEIHNSNMAIQIGQAQELTDLTYQNNVHALDKETFVKEYAKRCYLFSGRFYGTSFAMGAIMAKKPKELVNKYGKIGELFGTGGQMINDTGDFCMAKEIANCPEKDYQDQFADLVKGTITLPIYELAKYLDISSYVQNGMSNEDKKNCLEVMIKNRCFDSTRKITNAIKNDMVRQLSVVEDEEVRHQLKGMVSTFFQSNKFYCNLREEHGYDWSKLPKHTLDLPEIETYTTKF